ncbi:heat shock protein transcriptional repressor HspR [Streptoalloteichus hindustanus]|uniref:MerR family transcriptional regulator, heat shock protein HspR n=1 Tax=Streptoalloteichus hindustanus TaxID=2017 RepID=A0A1M4UQK4_STRHI|nr:helix-turn-helix transcriptional regulator [Streptoalloteichus hindustanus]SHE58984.1 MerR family transcriptional regulator, heat shock protein HspR [Streptoalloteichus hindustanus]
MTSRHDRPGIPFPPGADEDTPVFVISVAAQLAGLHAQTLRSYDRLGLVSPGRTPGGGRRYSARDIALLREVQRLSQEEGVNLAGVKRIIELAREAEALRAQVAELTARLAEAQEDLAHAHAAAEQAAAAVHASYRRELVPLRPRHQQTALMIWRPDPR